MEKYHTLGNPRSAAWTEGVLEHANRSVTACFTGDRTPRLSEPLLDLVSQGSR